MTGGVVLFAKGAAYQHATALFVLERRVEKRYWALTHGRDGFRHLYPLFGKMCGWYGTRRQDPISSGEDRRGGVQNPVGTGRSSLGTVSASHRAYPSAAGAAQRLGTSHPGGRPIWEQGVQPGHMAPGIKPFAADTLILPDWNGRPIALHSRPYFPHKALQKLGIEPDFFDHPVDGDGIGE